MDEGADTHPPQPDVMKALLRAAGVAVLLMLGCAAVAALIANVPDGTFVKLVIVLKFSAMIAAALAIGYLQFRNWAPALGASLAPIPAIGLSFALSALQPATFDLFAAFSYLLGFSIGLTIADSYVAAIVDDGEMSGRTIRRSDIPIAVASLIAVITPAFILAVTGRAGERIMALPALWSNAAAILFAVAAVPLACSLGEYGEDFITRHNRIRDDWNRWLDLGSGIAQPRWSSSAIGILVVFVVLATFGIASLHVVVTSRLTHFGVAAIGMSIVVVVAVTVAQSWRHVLAFTVMLLSGLAIMFWGFARVGAALDVRLVLSVFDLSALMAIPLAVWTACAARGGSDTELASARAMAEKGPIALLSAGSGFMLLVPWYGELDGARLGAAFAFVFAIVALTIFLPAAANVIDMMAPSRQAIADRYRVK